MPKEPTVQVAFRFSKRLLDRIDRHVKRMTRGQRDIEYSRADAVRDLITRALDERLQATKPGTLVNKSKSKQGEPSQMPEQDTTVTVTWHQPKCSHCRQPIESISDGHAGWREDEKDRTYDPVVVHTGMFCDYYDRAAPPDICDLPLDTFRRAPMEAVLIAMKRRSESREERLQWAIWLSVVLGLPWNTTWSESIMLAVEDEVATAVPDRVPSVAELTKLRGRQ